MHHKTSRRVHPPDSPVALRLPPPVLHGRYALEQVVGVGSCGRVYRAWDRQRGQPVALKCAHPNNDAEALLKQESETLTLLQHPAIPALVEYFEEGGRCYLVEEFCPGIPMRKMEDFTLSDVVWIGRECATVLAYLHERQLVHRDLKPGNLLIGDTSLTLLDFGLARHLGAPAWHCGTAGYVAPEQWNEGLISPAADLYSLGMLLICALLDCDPGDVLADPDHTFSARGQLARLLLPSAFPLLDLFERMIAHDPARRPTLADVQHTLQLLSTPPPTS